MNTPQTQASERALRTVPRGIMHVPVTPFKDDGAVDYATFERLVDWHVKQAPSSLCVILHIAESLSLTAEEHRRLIERWPHLVCEVGATWDARLVATAECRVRLLIEESEVFYRLICIFN